MVDANVIRVDVVAAIKARNSLAAVARDIGIAPEPLARFVAGLPVRKGTMLIIEQGYARMQLAG